MMLAAYIMNGLMRGMLECTDECSADYIVEVYSPVLRCTCENVQLLRYSDASDLRAGLDKSPPPRPH